MVARPKTNVEAELRPILAKYGLLTAPEPLLQIISAKVRAARRGPRISRRAASVLAAATRASVRSHALALIRYTEVRPKNPGTPAARRGKLLQLLTGELTTTVALAASTELDLPALIKHLGDGTESGDELRGLIGSLNRLPDVERSGRPHAAFAPLVWACAAAWRAAGRRERFTYYAERSDAKGPLVSFIQAVLTLAGIRHVSPLAIRDALLAEKKRLTFPA